MKGNVNTPVAGSVTAEDVTTAFAVDALVGLGWNIQVSSQALQVTGAAAFVLWHSVACTTWSTSSLGPWHLCRHRSFPR